MRESYKTELEATRAINTGRPGYYPAMFSPRKVMEDKWVVEWIRDE